MMSSQESKWKQSSFFTRKHSTHDVLWMVQNSNSETLCFACMMEMLEDENELNFKKKRVISEILDILTSNKLIWNILSRHPAVLSHTGKVLMKLMSTKDEHFLLLVMETFSVVIKKSNNDSLSRTLEILVNILRENQSRNISIQPAYINVLGKILQTSNMAVCFLVDQNQWLLEKIAEKISTSEEQEAVSYWYIFSQVYQKVDAKKIDITISEILLKGMSDGITKSSNKNLLINILAVLKYFSKSLILKKLIYGNENEEFVCDGGSFVEGLKRLLLSTATEIQIGAVQCIIELTTSKQGQNKLPVTVLVEKFIDKGLCEFLFELLNSSDYQVLEGVLLCLINFTNFQKFFQAGHLVFGLQPIVTALGRISKQKNSKLLHQTLTLILAVCQKSDKAIFAQGKLFHDIMIALAEVSTDQKTRTLTIVSLCVTEVVKRKPEINDVFLKSICKIFDDTGMKLVAEAKTQISNPSGIKDKIDLVSVFLDLLLVSLNLFQTYETKSQAIVSEGRETEDDLNARCDKLANSIFYIVDTCVIPVMMMWLHIIKDKKLFVGFFSLLNKLLECCKGLEFAKKLSNSSFIRIAIDLKSKFVKENNSEMINPIIDSFLIKLVCVLEDANDAITIGTILTEALPSLMTSSNEWHFYFTRRFTDDMHVIQCCQIASMALLYSAARFGNAIWKAETVVKVLSTFLSNESNFTKLPDVTKKNLVYLWSSMEPSTQGHHRATKYSCDAVLVGYLSNSDAFEKCYFHEKCYVRWILSSALAYKWKKLCLLKVFDFGGQNSQEKIEFAVDTLHPFRDNGDMIIMLCDMISSADETDCLAILHVALKLLRSHAQNAQPDNNVKEFIHKLILSKVQELRHINLSSLYDIFRALSLQAKSHLTEVDLKFMFRACNVFLEFPYLDVRIAILNCLNQLIQYMHSSRDCHAQISILCNAAFLKEINSVIPHELNFIDSQVEKLCVAGLVFISQIATVIAAINADIDALPILSFNKNALITGLGIAESKLSQLACIIFWKEFIVMADKHENVLQRVFGFANLTLVEAKTILAYLQNLVINQENILRGAALQCFSLLMNAMIKQDNMFQNPWNDFLLEQTALDLVNVNDIEYNLKLMRMLLGFKTPISHADNFISKIALAIKQYSETQQQNEPIHSLILAVVFHLIDHYPICSEVKDELNCFLHRIEDHWPEGSNKTQTYHKNVTFIEASGVVFPWENYVIPQINSYIKDIQKYRSKLTCAKG